MLRHLEQAMRYLVKNLSFGYGPQLLFKDLSVQTSSPRVVFKGPSGCGKTTLLKIISGHLLQGEKVGPPGMLVLQEDALFPWLTGWQNMSLFLRQSESEISSHPLFDVVSPFINSRAFRMSYGQRRSVELLRAICSKPKTLFLDEPFNFLDDARAERFIDTLLHPNWDLDDLVITTHRHDKRLDKASEVLLFQDGPPFTNLVIQEAQQ